MNYLLNKLLFIGALFIFAQAYPQTYNYDVFVGERLTFSIPKDSSHYHFSLENTKEGVIFDTLTGLFQWTPKLDDIGYHTFSYNVKSSHDTVLSTKRFSVHVVMKYKNQPPEIIVNKCTVNGRFITMFNIRELLIKEGDTLVIVFDIVDDEDVFTSYYFNGDLNMKSIPNSEVYLEEDYKRLELHFVPDELDARNKHLFFHVVTRDDGGATASRVIKLSVKNVNFPPQIVNKPLNEKYIFDDCDYIYQPEIKNDDNKKLDWMLVCDNSLREFLSFNNETGAVNIKIDKNKVLTDTILYKFVLKVKEENEPVFSDSVQVICKWKKSNQPPVILNLQTWEVKEGIESQYKIEAEDPNVNDAIEYNISSPNLQGVYIDKQTGILSLQADYDLVSHSEKSKEFKAYITVTDSKGLYSKELLTIKVFDRYDPSNIKSKYFSYKESLIELKSSSDLMYKNLSDIAKFLDDRDKKFNYLLSGMTILGAAGVLFADGTSGKNIATVIAAVPAVIKVYKEINERTDDETRDLIDDIVKQQSILAYKLDDLEARFTSSPKEKDFENVENINYILYVHSNELVALQSSFYYVQNKYNQLLSTGKHKKVFEKITKKRQRKEEKSKSNQRSDQKKYRFF